MAHWVTRYNHSLSLRPLLFMAPAAMAGCALGGMLAAPLLRSYLTRDLPFLALPLGAAFFFLFLCYRFAVQKYFWAARLCFAAMLCSAFCAYTLWRALPPAADLSQYLYQAEAAAKLRPMTLKAVPIRLRGYVAEAPRVSDFAQNFPLKSTFAESEGTSLSLRGNVWIKAPLSWHLRAGDLVEIRSVLRDIPRSGTAQEPNRVWRFILSDCWSAVTLSPRDSWHTLRHAVPWNFWLSRQLDTVRRSLLQIYQQRFVARGVAYPQGTAQLLVAMVFGDGALNSPLPPLVRDNFRAAGLTHLLVASGTQISLFMALVLGLLSVLGLRRFPWAMLFLLVFFLGFYALLVGGAPSIWRAFLAGICIAIALLLGRPVDLLSLWCFAALALLCIDPLQIYDLSFQLTFAATWGLIVIAPPLMRLLKRRLKSTFTVGLCSVGVYTLAAQLAVLPLLAHHFERISVAGLATNMIGIPVAGLLVGSGVLGLMIPWLTWPNALLTQFMAHLAALANSWDASQLRGVSMGMTGAWIYFLALFALPRWEEIRLIAADEWGHFVFRWREGGAGTLWLRRLVWGLAAVALIWGVTLFWPRSTNLHVAFLDVGQGDGIFIQTPSGANFLIDGGSINSSERGKVGDSVIVPYLQAHGVRQLDAVFLSHVDADHCNALDEVAAAVPVKLFLDGSSEQLPSGQIKEPPLQETDYWALRKKLQQQRVPLHVVRAGQLIRLDDGVTLQILAPMRPALASDNDRSMVIKLHYGKTSVLFTGDMEKDAENQLVRRGADLQSTILKVAHHGSNTSTTTDFLRAVNPAAAVISCGRYNSFGHPAPPTLQRLKDNRTAIFRTDLNGTVEVQSDGKRCYVKTFR